MDCESSPFCKAIEGTLWTMGQPTVPDGPRVYVGCQSLCEDHAGEDAFTCVYDSADPSTCFLVASSAEVPDGWSAFVECEAVPDGFCH